MQSDNNLPVVLLTFLQLIGILHFLFAICFILKVADPDFLCVHVVFQIMFPFTNNGGYWLSLGLSPLCSDSSSGSEEEAGPGDDMSAMEHWMSRPSQLGPAHLGSTSSSSSSTQSGGSGNAGRLADSLAHAHISHLAHTHLAHTHLGHHQQSHLSQSHHGKGTTFFYHNSDYCPSFLVIKF